MTLNPLMRRMRFVVLATAAGGMPLVTGFSCDPARGALSLIRDAGGDYLNGYVYDDFYSGYADPVVYEDVYYDDYYYDDYYYDDYVYDDYYYDDYYYDDYNYDDYYYFKGKPGQARPGK